MKIVIIIIMITPYEFFATALPNFLLLESESHQVFLGLQDASENSGWSQPCSGLDSFSDLQLFKVLFGLF